MAGSEAMDCGFTYRHPGAGDSYVAGIPGGMARLEPGNRHHGAFDRRRVPVFHSRFARRTGVSRCAAVMADPAHAAMGGMALDAVVCCLASGAGADHWAAMGRHVSASNILDCHPDPWHHIGAYTDCLTVSVAGDFDTLVCCSDLEISVRRTVLLNRKRDHG